MKKIIIFCITAILCTLQLQYPVFARETKWYASIMEYFISQDIISESYDPEAFITRGEAAAILKSTAPDENYKDAASPFTDLTEESPYYEDILYLYKNKIFSGNINEKGERTANAEETLNREQTCVLVSRAFHLYSLNSAGYLRFNDYGSVSGYAVNDVNDCINTWICVGYEDNSFRPQMPVTKAEFLSVIYNAVHKPSEPTKSYEDGSLVVSTFDEKYQTDDIRTSEVDYENKTLKYLIQNLSEKKYTFGKDFQLDINKAGLWYAVPYRPNVGWEMPVYSIDPFDVREHTFDLNIYFDELPGGTYRIILPMKSAEYKETDREKKTVREETFRMIDFNI